jgi:hypothetical protein
MVDGPWLGEVSWGKSEGSGSGRGRRDWGLARGRLATSMSAGTTNINAGGFSPLTTTIDRRDGEQEISEV